MSDFMGRHNETVTLFSMNPAKFTTLGINAPESVKTLLQQGVPPEELTNQVRQINSLEKEQKVDAYTNLANVNPEQIMHALSFLSKDDEMWKEI